MKVTMLQPKQPVRSHYVENFIVIWLVSNFNESDIIYYNLMSQFQRIVSSIETFTDIDECVDFLTDIKDQQVFFIVSDKTSETFVPLIHDVPQIDSIYIFYDNVVNHEQNMKEWRKVKAVVNDISFICDQLKQNTRQCELNLIPISIVSASSVVDLNELDQSFM
ncbi:unnamed protein product [Rotaria sp. Silwood2]|nr:unnamed protein product [Rotaria sp. Silwood2]